MTLTEYEPPLVPAVLLTESREMAVPHFSMSASATAPMAEMVSGSSSLPPVATDPYSEGAAAATTSYGIRQPDQKYPAVKLGRHPCSVQCTECGNEVLTKPYNRVNSTTVCAMIGLFIIFWPICWLPLCMPDCQTTEHYCGNCNQLIGKKKPCE